LFFESTGAVLEVVHVAVDDALIEGWRRRVQRAGARLEWLPMRCIARRHAGGVSLAISAPPDRLFTATEVNEWALSATLLERDPERFASLEAALVAAAAANVGSAVDSAAAVRPVIEESAALARFELLAQRETIPRLRPLLDAASARGLERVLDESILTLGAGAGGASFPLATLPAVTEVDWGAIRNIPTVLVTGSNGKTTTVRLIAACARERGWHAGYNCTDGVFFDTDSVTLGDYSGPVGARLVMREPRAEAAILETARGGILRRGLAVTRADAAVITNVSSDHFGEYGIDDLAGLADVKFAVAGVIGPRGLLVLNADDERLRAASRALDARLGRSPPVGWFAIDADHPTLVDHRSRALPTCGARGGRLCLSQGMREFDLGVVSAMPLSMDGVATYNVANLAAAALAAASIGVEPAAIARVFARFGERIEDNLGRMMRFTSNGVTVLVDYAHNPEGLQGFLKVAEHLREGGRLGLVLGHAGNRKDEDIEALARVAATFHPDLVVVKENETQLRGRELGEIPRIIHAQLKRSGLPDASLCMRASEVEAARYALDWSRPGDVLALPIHSASARAALMSMLSGASPLRENDRG
jgi:UDP-N-acetylmuramyl tripeptide synthase